MTPRARARLISIIIVVAGLGLAVALTLYGLSGKITYFHAPGEIAGLNEKQLSKTIRIGGLVKPGSLRREGETNIFTVTDNIADIGVTFTGVLPDLFREGQGVVIYGRYDPQSRIFAAKDVLAKHDENYMPPEVKKALEKK